MKHQHIASVDLYFRMNLNKTSNRELQMYKLIYLCLLLEMRGSQKVDWKIQCLTNFFRGFRVDFVRTSCHTVEKSDAKKDRKLAGEVKAFRKAIDKSLFSFSHYHKLKPNTHRHTPIHSTVSNSLKATPTGRRRTNAHLLPSNSDCPEYKSSNYTQGLHKKFKNTQTNCLLRGKKQQHSFYELNTF